MYRVHHPPTDCVLKQTRASVNQPGRPIVFLNVAYLSNSSLQHCPNLHTAISPPSPSFVWINCYVHSRISMASSQKIDNKYYISFCKSCCSYFQFLCCVFVLFVFILFLVTPMLPMSLDCPFLITPSVFSFSLFS